LEDYQPAERSAIISDCLQQNVWVNNVGADYKSSKEAVELSKKYANGIFAVVGAHPDTFLPEEKDKIFDIDKYKKLAEEDGAKVVGIGECGLDYYRIPEGLNAADVRELQEPGFVAQIKLAKELNKALVIHSRPTKNTVNVYEDTLQILKREDFGKFEMHSFTGSWEECKKFIELGAYVSINGILTFDKTGVIAELVKNIPFDRLVFETDAPFLAPVPFRGKKNQPQYVKYAVEFAAKILDKDYNEVEEIAFENSCRLFDRV
jgi:TatD DNase family protein